MSARDLPRADRYAYLNREPAWAGFELTGLERQPDGTLCLTRAPRPVAMIGPVPDPVPGPGPGPVDSRPAGLAEVHGDVYVSDPAGHRVRHVNPCLTAPAPLPCAGGRGPWPGQLDTPRGLAVLRAAAGPALAVAEEGNHRVQVFDLGTGQSLFTVGKTDPDGRPAAGSEPGQFHAPWGLAADRDGHLYVADQGNNRLQKVSPRGVPDAAFAAALAAGPAAPQAPVAVAVAGEPGQERVVVLDRAAAGARVVVVDTQGKSRAPGAFPVAEVAAATAVAVVGDSFYVGAADGSVARYDAAGRFRSRFAAPGARPVRALAAERSGTMLAGPGGWPLTRFDPTGGFVPSGHFRVGPIAVNCRPVAWQRWQVRADAPPVAAGVQLFTHVAPAGSAAPATGGVDDPFPGSAGWAALPRGALDVAVLDDDARAALGGQPLADSPDHDPDGPPRDVWIWLAGRLEGDGLVSPVLRQMRLDAAPGSSLRYLPRVYQEGAIVAPPPDAPDTDNARYRRARLQSRLLLDLWLAALDGELGRTGAALAELPRRFDPAAAPADGLAWLASWLDFDWTETWPEAEARTHLAGAFALARLRGTAAGLRQYLKLYAGVDAWIEEPAAPSGGAPLVLGETATLGFDAVLAPAHAYGAVLARTATLGQSHLLDPAAAGVPLFADVAHRFCVQVHAAQVAAPAARAALLATLAREAPAHAPYHVCVLQPRMRVGFQARLGVDTVVAGPAPDLELPAPPEAAVAALGVDAVLSDQPRRSNRLGQGARAGLTLGTRG
jgi:phage tail-like protein